jgi:hypothetical protein
MLRPPPAGTRARNVMPAVLRCAGYSLSGSTSFVDDRTGACSGPPAVQHHRGCGLRTSGSHDAGEGRVPMCTGGRRCR